ncbi:hypothetical protein TNCV_1175301 [Trichonephila clavipes]|nr:hypothetical protein TNCV_1175301 [Trichonephila clavipes]
MEVLEKMLDVEEVISVQYSIWIGDKVELARTWQLKRPLNNSIYDVIETIDMIDNRQKYFKIPTVADLITKPLSSPTVVNSGSMEPVNLVEDNSKP